MELLLFVCIASIVAFVLFAWDKRRQHYNLGIFPAWLMMLIAAAAPFGALCSMLMFNNRLKSMVFVIGVPLLLAAWVLGIYFLWPYH